jgi:DNA-binding SARP family transcriptional activator
MVAGAPPTEEPNVKVCVLGSFRILASGRHVSVRPGGKIHRLVGSLALHGREGMPRDELIGLVWPESDQALGGQSLNTLVYSLRRLLSDALLGSSPVVLDAGRYRLNTARIIVDVVEFDAAMDAGDDRARLRDRAGAIEGYQTAAALYTGDLAVEFGVQGLIERERLRARLMTGYGRLADLHFLNGDFEKSLETAMALLSLDACREDAHRIAMRSYVRSGQRAQALRQYQICRDILQVEFDARPEDATNELFRLVRIDPGRV